MNEYGDILNRIVEEFYDTGKVVLKELDLPDVENEDFGVESEDDAPQEEIESDEEENDLDYEVLKSFWLKYKQLPRYNRIRNVHKDIRIKDLYPDYPKDITLGTWVQYITKIKKFNDLYIKLLDEFNLYEENEIEKKGGKNYVATDSKGNNILLRSNGEVIAFNTLKYYGLDQDVEIDSRKFYNSCGDVYKEVDFLIPKFKTVIEIAGGESEKYFEKLEIAKECIEKFGWRCEYIKTKGKNAKYIHDRIVDILNINNSNYNHDEIINYKSLDKNKVKDNLIKNLIDSEVNPYNETTRKRLEKGIEIIYGDNMSVSKLKNLHREAIKDFLNGDIDEKEKEFYLTPYLELISKKHKCDKCGKYKSEPRSKLCNSCSRLNRRKTERPPCEELLKPNINKSQIGRDYGVSDTAVKKWIQQCKKQINNDDELDSIIENFFDTGKVVLKELDLPDELKWQSGAIRDEIDQLLKNAKGRFNKGLYQKEKEDYEQFLEIVIGSPIEDEYQEEIETAKGRIEFIEKFLPQKKEIEKKEEEKTSFEQSIENIQTQELTSDFYSKIISANPKKVREAFDQNPCLYNEIINVNPDIRKFIIKNSGGEPKNCVDGEINACLTNKNPFVTHIENNDEISNNDKKELKSVLVDNAIKNQRRVRETCEDNPMSIINKYVTTFDSKKKDIEEKLPEDSILNKNIETKLKKCYSIIQSIMTEMNENKVVQQIPKTKNIFSDLMDSIVTYTKGAGENMPSTELVDKNVVGSLNQIIYDLYQLLLIIQSYDVYDDKEKTQILNIIKNISDQVNNKEGLSENFFKIREIRNQKYEKSFACGGYFEQTTGGNNPKIINVTNNNQYLMGLLENGGEPYDIATEIYNLINPQKITESLEKHDIKSNEEITLENGTIIPKDSKIEVKLTSRYSDYHLSEFFGVYKNKPLDEYTDRYNKVITELKEMLKVDDKGIIQKIKDTTAGIFYENYMYTPISNVKIEWSDMGQRPTEKRLSLRVTVEDESKISQWTKQNGNCNCEPFLKGVACPQNESTDRLDNIIETFFDTGKFIL